MTNEIQTNEDLPVIDNSIETVSVGREAATSLAEIKAAIVMARELPRNENAVFQKLMEACKRKSFAVLAEYSYPRGQSKISGPSVNLAREAAKIYGNMRWGLRVISDSEQKITIEGWAWDVENNVKAEYPDTFKKLVYRRATKDRAAGWYPPDERDLRELIFRRGAIVVRTAILNVLPRDYIDDAIGMARITKAKDIKDPAAEKKTLIMRFGELGVSVAKIDKYIKTSEWTIEDLVELGAILTAVKDGAAKLEHYFGEKSPENDKEPKSQAERILDKTDKKKPEGEPETVASVSVDRINGAMKCRTDSLPIQMLENYSPEVLEVMTDEERSQALDEILKFKPDNSEAGQPEGPAEETKGEDSQQSLI